MLKRLFIVVAIFIALLSIVLLICSDKTLLTHPLGIIARGELKLMTTNILLMLIIVVPTYIFLFFTAWKYRASNPSPRRKPPFPLKEPILWMIPAVIVVVMAVITYKATHALDPYKPLTAEAKPLKIQVVALDWKWLFIYPEQGIATLNFIQFPERTPVHLTLSADGSPMNSFWLPQLSGQIYAMSGMVTPLHIMADGPGIYSGRAAEINGAGFADMTFVAKSTSQEDFEAWVAEVKQAPLQLTDSAYNELVQRSQNNPVTFYSFVEENLFHRIVMKYAQ